jgi:hypothetical protein
MVQEPPRPAVNVSVTVTNPLFLGSSVPRPVVRVRRAIVSDITTAVTIAPRSSLEVKSGS